LAREERDELVKIISRDSRSVSTGRTLPAKRLQGRMRRRKMRRRDR
jgi:hypothetical protein